MRADIERRLRMGFTYLTNHDSQLFADVNVEYVWKNRGELMPMFPDA